MSFGFFSIMNDVDDCLYGSIGQAATDAGWTNTWTTATMNKTNSWLSGGAGPNPPSGSIQAQINGLPDDADKVATFIQNYCNANNINLWSTALVVALQNKIAQYYNQDDWGAILGSVGSFASMVSSAMTQDTTTGDTEGKNMQSQLQTDNTALQPISDFGGSWVTVLTNLANVLSQVGPGG